MISTGIALFVYNRPEHTAKVLEGLKDNKVEKLYIFADGIKKEEHRRSVTAVRKLVGNIQWCKTEIIASQVNKGLAKSVVDGVNYVLEKHDTVIVLEDDCIPGDNFISFMKDCFIKYKDKEKVMAVTGYGFPITVPEEYGYDVYFSKRASSWGWGTWKRAWNLFRKDNIFDEVNKSAELRKAISFVGNDLLLLLKMTEMGLADSWYVYWSINIIQNNGICISPTKSRIKNIGFDGSGVHTTIPIKKYDVELTAGKGDIRYPRLGMDTSYFDKSINDLFKLNLIELIKSVFIRYTATRKLYLISRNCYKKTLSMVSMRKVSEF